MQSCLENASNCHPDLLRTGPGASTDRRGRLDGCRGVQPPKDAALARSESAGAPFMVILSGFLRGKEDSGIFGGNPSGPEPEIERAIHRTCFGRAKKNQRKPMNPNGPTNFDKLLYVELYGGSTMFLSLQHCMSIRRVP